MVVLDRIKTPLGGARCQWDFFVNRYSSWIALTLLYIPLEVLTRDLGHWTIGPINAERRCGNQGPRAGSCADLSFAAAGVHFVCCPSCAD